MAYQYVELNPGIDGSKVAADIITVGGVAVEFQRIKQAWGVEGSAVDVSLSDPLPVQGTISVSGNQRVHGVNAHDAAITADPVLVGGRASAAAPTDVSADNDLVRAWMTRAGATVVALSAAGALLTGDASFGLDVDVTRVPAPLNVVGSGTQAAALRVTLATDSPLVSALVTEDAASAANPIGFQLMGRVLDTVPTGLGIVSSDQDHGAISINRQGALWVELLSGEQKIAGDATNGLDVDVTRVPAPLNVVGSGTQAAALRVTLATDSPGSQPLYVEDDAAPANPTGGATMVRVRSTPGVEVSTSGDFASLSGPVEGGVWTALLGDGVPAERIGGTAANGLDVDVTRVSGNVTVVGTAAIDAAVSGNPIYIASRASTATPTAVSADGDVQALWLDRNGRAHVVIDAINLSPTVQGNAAHDSDGLAAGNPLMGGGIASAAAPADVSADLDAVRSWHLRNGAQVVQLSAAGALIGGDATNGLDVDVTRVNGNVLVTGAQARDASIGLGPVLVGGRAGDVAPAAVSANGDLVDLWLDRTGATVVVGPVAPDQPVGSFYPVLGGLKASTSTPTAVNSDQDAVVAWGTREGAAHVRGVPTAGATLANVSHATSSTTLLAANTGRYGATIFNDSANRLWVKFGSSASATSFTVLMLPGEYYEVPYGYTGILTGISDVASGTARVTEITI